MRWLRASIAAGLTLAASGAGVVLYELEQAKQSRRAIAMTGGDPKRALAPITRFGCAACHSLPGVRARGGQVGPPLAGVASRVYLAGTILNTPENMIRYIVDPKQLDRRTAMPVTGISEREARDVVAYLYRLR
jgi:cytochrome c2